MKGFMKASLVAVILVALVFVSYGTVRAEEPDHMNQLIEDKVYESYNEYHYPSGNRLFYLPRQHEVKFDVHNGKYFQVMYFPHTDRDAFDTEEEFSAVYHVYFYTPDGRLFAIRRLTRMDLNRYYSLPHSDRSPNYDRLIVKIQNTTNYNKDFLFKVLDPVDPVKGTPLKNVNFRLMFH